MKKPSRPLAACAAAAAIASTTAHLGADIRTAAEAINSFGLDLHQRLAETEGNLVTSPWSIQSALAMTFAGAEGETLAQMAATLHFPADEDALHAGLAALTADLATQAEQSRLEIDNPDRQGGPNTPLEILAANRLFGQEGYPFLDSFLDLTRNVYGAPLQQMDFEGAPEPSRQTINAWVAENTRDRIEDLIPGGVIDEETRLVLANAVYLMAPWAEEFKLHEDFSFFLPSGSEIQTTALHREGTFGVADIPGGTLVSIPYHGGGLQFLLIIPETRDGLAALERSLTPDTLAAAAAAPPTQVDLLFPKFRIEPPSVTLADHLIEMGMPAAFDKPEGSADFSRMAPRTPNEYLYIGEVVHRAFLAVDQYGTEAAAATAVVMMRATSAIIEPEPAREIHVDRPFAFAIQHTASGACLFLGRVSNPD